MEQILLIWSIATFVLLLVAIYWVYTLERKMKAMEERYRQILKLAEESDEATLVRLLGRLDEQEAAITDLQGKVEAIRAAMPHVIQGYGIVRYSAFADMGGDQSFSLALVDAGGSGLLITALHGREETRIYAKPLVQWRSTYSLSAEEQEALGKARAVMTG